MPAILSVLMSSQRLTFWQTWVFLVVEGARGRRSFEVTGLLGFFVVVWWSPRTLVRRRKKVQGQVWLKWSVAVLTLTLEAKQLLAPPPSS